MASDYQQLFPLHWCLYPQGLSGAPRIWIVLCQMPGVFSVRVLWLQGTDTVAKATWWRKSWIRGPRKDSSQGGFWESRCRIFRNPHLAWPSSHRLPSTCDSSGFPAFADWQSHQDCIQWERGLTPQWKTGVLSPDREDMGHARRGRDTLVHCRHQWQAQELNDFKTKLFVFPS